MLLGLILVCRSLTVGETWEFADQDPEWGNPEDGVGTGGKEGTKKVLTQVPCSRLHVSGLWGRGHGALPVPLL
jgi:hypothetical protein